MHTSQRRRPPHRLRKSSPVAMALAMLFATLLPSAATAGWKEEPFQVLVLSNRADLVSDGDALVEVRIPSWAVASEVAVDVDGRDVTDAFAVRSDGRFYGRIDGLRDGVNVISARPARGVGARITVTNHSGSGPVFAGPQVDPWICATSEYGLGPAQDDQCNAPTQTSYVYQPHGAEDGAYQPYDPKNPPSDVATTTTDQGRTVPYIVRVEKGTLDRGIFMTAVLADPSKPWEPWEPQETWNGKVFIPFGGGCGTVHRQTAPESTGSLANRGVLDHHMLSRGFLATSSGLNIYEQNCNEVVSAEAVMMQKEHVEEKFGPIRYTIGTGCSGGSIQVQNIAAAYPGLLDGIVPTCSFPDAWHVLTDAVDCYLLTNYFLFTSPHLWALPAQQTAVMGKAGPGVCAEWTATFSDDTDPQNRGAFHIGTAPTRPGCGLPAEQTYDPETNPDGVRCSIQDYQRSIWGERQPDQWGVVEKQIGSGFAPVPLDNSGVQYGLKALELGLITADQFIDLNSKVGGLDVDAEFQQNRMSMDESAATTMYRAGRHSDPRQLARTVILDVRNHHVDGDVHQPYSSYVMRARLDAANGNHANQVIWNTVGAPYTPGPEETLDDALLAVDRWLAAVEQDDRDVPLTDKIAQARPSHVVDTCWIAGRRSTDVTTCRNAYPYFGDPRIAAGSPLSGDVRKCQLKPLDPRNYSVVFTPSQWTALTRSFPNGACDWTKPSVGAQPSVPWMTYGSGPGGTPIGAPPSSAPLGRSR